MSRQSREVPARAGKESRATDPELMRRIAAGEIGALGELYDRHRHAVRSFVARATADAEDVDDLVHTTFLTAARAAARYDGRAVCRPWLIGIAVTLLRRRRHGFRRWVTVLSSFGASRAGALDPSSALQARGDIERALRQISEPKRMALLLAEVEELSCAEIAEMLGIPIGTVWTRVHAARRELRELLDGGAP